MSGAHRKPTRTSRLAGRAGRTSATVALGGAAAIGLGAGMASAGTLTHAGGASVAGDSATGPSSSLVNVSGNQTPIQICHDQVPVNVLGVQVPVQDATGALSLTGLHSKATTPATADNSCHLAAAQGN
jgi:hypothetical protein